ncbi:hypothetical protein TKK_0018784 [Trichogramma kaykai]
MTATTTAAQTGDRTTERKIRWHPSQKGAEGIGLWTSYDKTRTVNSKPMKQQSCKTDKKELSSEKIRFIRPTLNHLHQWNDRRNKSENEDSQHQLVR